MLLKMTKPILEWTNRFVNFTKRWPKSLGYLKTILLHLIFWTTYAFYESLVAHFAGLAFKLDTILISFSINAMVFYGTWNSYKYIKANFSHAATIFLLTLGFTCLSVITSTALKICIDAFINHQQIVFYATKIRIASLVMRSFYFAVMGLTYGFARQAIQKEKEAAIHHLERMEMIEKQQIAEKKSLTTNLNLIKSQINPHFVFNTLGLLHSETYKILPDVGKSIILLSNIMRYALTKNVDGYSTLESEINYIKDFIKIHEARNKSFYLKTAFTDNVVSYQVISMILITLVENVFKHGILNQYEKEAVLRIHLIDGKLHYYSLNYKNTLRKIESNGIGLNYVRERLMEEYNQQFELLINETADTYECKLVMPLKTYDLN